MATKPTPPGSPAKAAAAKPAAPGKPTVADLAKGALRRLALAKQEPTPDNYAKAYAEEAGERPAEPGEQALPERAKRSIERLALRASDDAAIRDTLAQAAMKGQWDDVWRQLDRLPNPAATQAQTTAQLIDRVARGLERGGRQWTAARKKESLQRVLDNNRSDIGRLHTRLGQLLHNWETDTDDAAVETATTDEVSPASSSAEPVAALQPGEVSPSPEAAGVDPAWPPVVASLQTTVDVALPFDEPRARELADELAALAQAIGEQGATPSLVQSVEAACERARRLLSHRHHLVAELALLCQELTAGLTDLAEDDSWAKGQAESMQARLGEGISARSVRAASEMLAKTRAEQQVLRGERDMARQALKGLIQTVLQELGDLGEHTGRFQDRVTHYADVIEHADSLADLGSVVREMVEESRAVQLAVGQSRERLSNEQARAAELTDRVQALETELRRLSEEVSTDALTQIANRRGMMQAFEAEQARLEREGGELAVGLLDIDDFKKLNDTLGHAAGDEALKALAKKVSEALRPLDRIARFGGEEFVVLLPQTPLGEAQQVLTRLQRLLSASLFMHDNKPVFVTFSAGVTTYRPGERLEVALERADEALYEAKRTGKNRTCTC